MSVDLLRSAQAAVFAALKPLENDLTLPTGLQVLVHVPILGPDDKLPPMVIVGMIQSEDDSPKGARLETMSVGIDFVYRSDQRQRLLSMMNAARDALVGREISIPGSGALFEYPRFISSVADKVMPDGVTYLGVMQVQFQGWPA